MLSIGKLGRGQERYYLEAVADGAEDYYVSGREAPGTWLGGGAAELGLTGRVEAEHLGRVLGAAHPTTGERLAKQTKVPGFDLTFSAPKSVSVLFGLGDEPLAAQLREAHAAAVKDALGYLQRTASHARRGHGGLQRLTSDGFVAAAFPHRTSRNGDPQLHTHVVVANAVRGQDGRWSALDARALYVQAKTAGTLYEASLRYQLRALGLSWTVADNGLAELDAVPRPVLKAFSTRRTEIEDALADRGLTSARAAQVATLTTRQAKDRTADPDGLRHQWRERAAALGFGAQELRRALQPNREVRAPDLEPLLTAGGLTARSSTFGERELLRAVANAHDDGASVAEVERMAAALLQDARVVALSERERALRGEATLRRRGGRLVPMGASERRWSTQDLLTVEQGVVDSAVHGLGVLRALAPEVAEAALDERPHLVPEQQQLVRSLVTSRDRVQVIAAAAGAGKTTALGAAVKAWQQAGVPVVGVTLAAKAATVLSQETGLPAFTLARALLDLRTDSAGLRPGTVLLVDEAGQVGTRALAELLQHVEAAGGRLVLVGDPHQLPEIEAGGAYRGLLNRLPVLELEGNRRQVDPEDRERLRELRKGDVVRALRSYDEAGRLVRAEDGAAAVGRLVGDWAEAFLSRNGDVARQDVIMLGLTNADVERLNERARHLLREAGELQGPDACVGERQFAVGDHVVTRHNDRLLGVLNGDRWLVAKLSAGEVTLHSADGRRRAVVPSDYDDLHHAYALTTAVAQGSSVDFAYVLGSDATYREAGYTAASRARQATTFYVVAAEPEQTCASRHGDDSALDPVDEFARALSRSAAEDMALDAEPGVDPAYIKPALVADEEDRLRERMAECPADLRPRLARVRRELRQAEEQLQSRRAGGDLGERWQRRHDELAREVAGLDEHQRLREEWLASNVAAVERWERLLGQRELTPADEVAYPLGFAQ